MRTRTHVPRTGRRRKLRFLKRSVKRTNKGRSPKQIAAAKGRKRAARRKR